MSKREKPPVRDVAELLVLGGALWLGFRGIDPKEIAARAQESAERARALLQAIERTAENHMRQAAGCRAPDACECVMCLAARAEGKTP